MPRLLGRARKVRQHAREQGLRPRTERERVIAGGRVTGASSRGGGDPAHFPRGWDACIRDTVALLDPYRIDAQHLDFHRRQLTLAQPSR